MPVINPTAIPQAEENSLMALIMAGIEEPQANYTPPPPGLFTQYNTKETPVQIVQSAIAVAEDPINEVARIYQGSGASNSGGLHDAAITSGRAHPSTSGRTSSSASVSPGADINTSSNNNHHNNANSGDRRMTMSDLLGDLTQSHGPKQ
jgi:hypothetical protein